MDSKITLSFDKQVIEAAKDFADKQGISLSRLTEYLYRKLTHAQARELEAYPIADWVMQLADGEAEYKTKPRKRKDSKKDFFETRK